MSRILDAARRLLSGRAADTKASAVGPLIAWEPLGQPVWAPRDYSAFAREGFMQNAIVYRSVRMIAEAAASVPLLLYERDEEITQHPLLDLIAHPSPDHTTVDFLESWYGFLLVSGNAYVEAVGLSGRLRELHVLRPDRMKVIPGETGWPEAFEYSAAGRSVRFEAEPVYGVRPILHVRLFHPDNDHYGMSPIEAAANAIDIHNAAGSWNKALLDNAARPSGALVYAGSGGNLTGEQYARLKSELEESYQGAINAGRPLLLEGGLDWKPLSFSPKDMDFVEAKNAAAREIALALGVPPMLLGIPGDNTYSNYQEAQRAFWRGTVLPLISRMTKAFSGWLAPAFGDGLVLKADLDQVEGLSAEREALWARLNASSFLTVNEKRAAVGYGPVDFAPPDATTPEEKAGYDPSQPRVPSGSSDGGQWTGGGGGNGGGRGSSSSSSSNSGSEGPKRIRVAQAEDRPSARIDLHEHEKRGGHTIAEHVGRSDSYLLARARGERGPAAIRRRVGSFLSLEAATKLVSSTLAKNQDIVGRVASGELDDAFITSEFDTKTGREAYAPTEYSDVYLRDTHGVAVLIIHDDTVERGFTIWTAYPRNPE